MVDAYNVVVHPVDWWGNEKKEQEFTGRDAEGNEHYKSVPIEETVPLRLCMRGSIEDVQALRTAVASAIARCEGIGAKGELSELRDVSHTLEHGRSGPLRATRGGFENAAWNIFSSGNSSDVRAYEESATAAAELDRKAEQMARQRTEFEEDRRRQEAADAKSRKRAAEAESRAADTERLKEEYQVKKAQEAEERRRQAEERRQQAGGNRRSGGPDLLHNPITAAILCNSPLAPFAYMYYGTRTAVKAGQAIASGDGAALGRIAVGAAIGLGGE